MVLNRICSILNREHKTFGIERKAFGIKHKTFHIWHIEHKTFEKNTGAVVQNVTQDSAFVSKSAVSPQGKYTVQGYMEETLKALPIPINFIVSVCEKI